MIPRATSTAAKKSVKKVTGTLRGQIFRYVLGNGMHGATLTEITEGLDIRLQTVCARRCELGKMGLITDGGKRRLSPSNRSSIVWIVPSRVAAAAKKKGLI